MTKNAFHHVGLVASIGVLAFTAPSADANQAQTDMPQLTQVETINMAAAIVSAEAHSGGRAIEAERDEHGGRLVYEVDVFTGDGVTELRLDAQTGEVLSSKEDKLENALMRTFRKGRMDSFRSSDINLANFVTAVEQETGGAVESVDLDTDDDALYIEFDVRSATGEREVVVDPATGSMFLDELD